MDTKEFKEAIYELAFGDNAINRGFSEEEVVATIKEFANESWIAEEQAAKLAVSTYILIYNWDHNAADAESFDSGCLTVPHNQDLKEAIKEYMQKDADDSFDLDSCDGGTASYFARVHRIMRIDGLHTVVNVPTREINNYIENPFEVKQ